MLRLVSPRRPPLSTSRCRRPGAEAHARCRVGRRRTPAAGATTRTRKRCLVCAPCYAWRPSRAVATTARETCAVQVRRGNGPGAQAPQHRRGPLKKRARDARGADLRRPGETPWLPPQTAHGIQKGRSGSPSPRVCARLAASMQSTDVCQHHPSAQQRGAMRQVSSMVEIEAVHTAARAQAGGLRRPQCMTRGKTEAAGRPSGWCRRCQMPVMTPQICR